LKRPLNIGNARDDPVSVYRLDKGMLDYGPLGADRWNPGRSGKTTFSLQFFARYQDLDEISQPELLAAETNGLEARLDYDNTDFPRNPSRGSRSRFAVARDFGWFESSNSWTSLELEWSGYLDLGTSDWFRQKVIALDFWTSYSPTWTADEDNPSIISNRPPAYKGATLGGFDRMRAFPSGRFNDKAAVYFTGELRMTPRTNPLRDFPVLNYFEIDWWQLAGFAEAGRVGTSYNLDLYHEDLKFDAGIDLRLMAYRNVVRLGIAWSDEGSQIWAMFEQPFARK
jgi:outer membrane protein assembly factor BamA